MNLRYVGLNHDPCGLANDSPSFVHEVQRRLDSDALEVESIFFAQEISAHPEFRQGVGVHLHRDVIKKARKVQLQS